MHMCAGKKLRSREKRIRGKKNVRKLHKKRGKGLLDYKLKTATLFAGEKVTWMAGYVLKNVSFILQHFNELNRF